MVTPFPMNSFNGHIIDINTKGNLSVVTVEVGDAVTFQTIVIETPQTAKYLQKNSPVTLIFKETETVIAKQNSRCDISIVNRIDGKIIQIETGSLLSNVLLETTIGNITATVFSDSIKTLSLAIDDEVTAFINPHEIMLSS